MDEIKQKTFRDLEKWQLGIQLVTKNYILTNSFPESERFILTTQIRRSAVSAPSNIAEGSRRNSSLEFIRFLKIALGSLAEPETQLVLAQEIGYIREDSFNELFKQINHISKKTYNLCKRLSNQQSIRLSEHGTVNALHKTHNEQP